MEKRVYSLFQRVVSVVLCTVMLMTVLPAPVAATQAAEGTAETETIETVVSTQETEGPTGESEPEWILPECDCGSTEAELGKHGETCARKVFLEEFCEETAADIFAKWEKLPEECQKYILEYLSKDEADAEKLAELKGFIDAAQTDPAEKTADETEGSTDETEASTEETEGTTEETEASTNETEETEAPEKETEATTGETEGTAEESEEVIEEPSEETVPAVTEEAIDGIAVQADDGVFTILTASDFQDRDGIAGSVENVTAILGQVKKHHSIEAFMFCGDYSNEWDAKSAIKGYNALRDTLSTELGYTIPEQYLIQGNHDPYTKTWTPSVGYEKDKQQTGYLFRGFLLEHQHRRRL